MLGERMIEERKRGHYASVRFDKLFINDSIYKFDDQTDQIVYIGKRSRFNAEARGRGNHQINPTQRLDDSERGNSRDTNEESHDGSQPIENRTDSRDDIPHFITSNE
jgi:hypothetical protein